MATVEFAKGLEGVIVNTTQLSKVDGENGKLYYCGYTIEDLAENCNFEEVSFLLMHKRLPNKQELEEFDAQLKKERCLTPELEASIVLTPKKGHPMAVLQALVSMLAMHDDEIADKSIEAKERKAIRIIAKMPTVVTMFDALREGRPVVRPNKNLSHAANMLYMMTGRIPSDIEEKIFDKALILHMDHGCNASTFTARVVTSTEADIYTSVVAALGALSGPLHGGANEKVLQMLEKVKADEMEEYIDKKIENKEKIMGFGHRVYKVWDPRAIILRKLAVELTEKMGEGADKVDFAEKFAQYTLKRFAEIGKTNIYPNVDYFSGAVYACLGLPTDFFTPVFAISRVVGWVAHHYEQLVDNRIYRPKLYYNGAELGRKFERPDA
ncbi:MAG: citrate synthase [Candidatus Delongbacteria bacterium]|nr:citrate synthase [Candidatus Delongbacteria bacterium]MBN2836892.1 citrate synthase [Candidatus Delongbacteria bacterium]